MIFKLPYQKMQAISYITRIDRDMLCIVQKERRTRSLVQNNYYWLLLTMLQIDSGIDKDDWHIFFGDKFLRHTTEIKGELIESIKSTTKLTTIQMENYLEKIRVFSSRELGVFLPLPGETEHDYLNIK